VSLPAYVEDCIDPVEVVLEAEAYADRSWCLEEFQSDLSLECPKDSITEGSSRVLPE